MSHLSPWKPKETRYFPYLFLGSKRCGHRTYARPIGHFSWNFPSRATETKMMRQNATTVVVGGWGWGALTRLFILPRIQSLRHPSIYSRSLYITDCQTTNLANYFFSQIKFCWHTAMPMHLLTVSGCFGATVAELNSCNTGQLIKHKTFPTWPFAEDFPSPALHPPCKSLFCLLYADLIPIACSQELWYKWIISSNP